MREVGIFAVVEVELLQLLCSSSSSTLLLDDLRSSLWGLQQLFSVDGTKREMLSDCWDKQLVGV